MTAREELTTTIAQALRFDRTAYESGQDVVDALTPDLWLRYGLEMGWVEQVGYRYETKHGRGWAEDERVGLGWKPVYRFTVGAEKEGE